MDLTGFLSVNVVLEGLEVFTVLYESEESWGHIGEIVPGSHFEDYVGVIDYVFNVSILIEREGMFAERSSLHWSERR